jgi:hypothetical protein
MLELEVRSAASTAGKSGVAGFPVITGYLPKAHASSSGCRVSKEFWTQNLNLPIVDHRISIFETGLHTSPCPSPQIQE